MWQEETLPPKREGTHTQQQQQQQQKRGRERGAATQAAVLAAVPATCVEHTHSHIWWECMGSDTPLRAQGLARVACTTHAACSAGLSAAGMLGLAFTRCRTSLCGLSHGITQCEQTTLLCANAAMPRLFVASHNGTVWSPCKRIKQTSKHRTRIRARQGYWWLCWLHSSAQAGGRSQHTTPEQDPLVHETVQLQLTAGANLPDNYA